MGSRSPWICLYDAYPAQDLSASSGSVRHLGGLVEVSPPGLDVVVLPKQGDTQ